MTTNPEFPIFRNWDYLPHIEIVQTEYFYTGKLPALKHIPFQQSDIPPAAAPTRDKQKAISWFLYKIL